MNNYRNGDILESFQAVLKVNSLRVSVMNQQNFIN